MRINSYRPVLVVSNDAVNHALSVSTVIPFSSIKKGVKTYPTEIIVQKNTSNLEKDSVVMIHQIRTISHKRLEKKISELKDIKIRQDILNNLKNYFNY